MYSVWRGIAALGILTLASVAQASPVGALTVGEYRAYDTKARIFMVAGALEVLSSATQCPQMVTVGEWDAALMYQPLKESENWVNSLVVLMASRGCTLKEAVHPNA